MVGVGVQGLQLCRRICVNKGIGVKYSGWSRSARITIE